MNAVISSSSWKQEIRGKHTTVVLPFEFDWKKPDYQMVFAHRAQRLVELRKHPESFEKLKRFYKTNIPQMICDWGCTYDPRNIEIGLPATVPFILFPKQIDWVDWVIAHWRARKPGLTEKSRDCGVSWLAMCLSCELAKLYQGLPIGFGSATADKVDESDNPDCLFYKGRFYLNNIPWELRGGWTEKNHSFYMRLVFPETSSFIGGDSGDQIGRGGRRAIYFVDEAAHLMRPQKVESSLISTTNCRMDISSVSGMANPFAQKRHKGKVDYFTFHWRDDPRKGQEWYDKLKGETDDVTLAQDVDINYLASTTGQVIPAAWVEAAIGAHIKLGISSSGIRRGGFDVADGGNQTVFAGRHGFLLQDLIAWQASGNSDTYKSVVRAINICDEKDYNGFDYDADGIGASVRGDALNINTERRHVGLRWIYDEPFRGSGAVFEPEAEMVKERKNKDFFLNLKAQSWWALRIRFNNTWRAVNGLPDVDLDNIICIDPHLDNLTDLIMQLAQPTYDKNSLGKIVIDKTPDGSSSPDLADAVMIAFNPTNGMADIWAKLAQ